MLFSDNGTMLKSLQTALVSAMEEAHAEAFGTTRFFTIQALKVHQAYNAWAASQHVLPEYRAALRNVIETHVRVHTSCLTQAIRILIDTLPDQFNVHGKWVP